MKRSRSGWEKVQKWVGEGAEVVGEEEQKGK